jgi:hypothetical protein
MGLRFLRILDPDLAFRDARDNTIWGDDQIHPTEADYDLLAVQQLVERVQPPAVRKRRREEGDGNSRNAGPQGRGPPVDQDRARTYGGSSRGGRGEDGGDGDNGDGREYGGCAGDGRGGSRPLARGGFREPNRGNNRRMGRRGCGGGRGDGGYWPYN